MKWNTSLFTSIHPNIDNIVMTIDRFYFCDLTHQRALYNVHDKCIGSNVPCLTVTQRISRCNKVLDMRRKNFSNNLWQHTLKFVFHCLPFFQSHLWIFTQGSCKALQTMLTYKPFFCIIFLPIINSCSLGVKSSPRSNLHPPSGLLALEEFLLTRLRETHSLSSA